MKRILKVYLGVIILTAGFLFFNMVSVLTASPPAVTGTTSSQVHKGVPAASQDGHHAPHLAGKDLSLLWALPFAGILLSIALFPLAAPHFWHHHYGKISLFWGVSFLSSFTVVFGWSMSLFYLLEVYLLEFIPFIMLLLALFTVSGGIRLKGYLAGTPQVNAAILLVGTLLASWMGTTGAAMLLIRPLLRANAWRRHKTHVVVFFIFLVANVGGSLTPLGDPPLFLGFLKGVSFFWTTRHLFLEMVVVSALLVVIFIIMDMYYFRKEEVKPEVPEKREPLALEGKANILLIPAVVGSVLLSSMDLGNAFTVYHVTVKLAAFLQIILLLAITLVSLKITDREVRIGNDFSWEPIREVAKLFATIFITMVPPIAMLKAGVDGPLGVIIGSVVDGRGEFINANFFWATGILSSFLDNAPTYVVFFETAGGNAADLMTKHADTLIAISCGAVFMGANTYIGNAPNFMVKSIAEEAGVPMPSFFGYLLKYSLPILIPLFLLVTYIFF